MTADAGAQARCELLVRAPDVTAVAAANDLIALGCYGVLADRGLTCPDDISIVGFNDMPFCDRFYPPRSTVRIGHYEIGREAADLMLELLQDPEAAARQLQVEPELVVRSSTAAPVP